MALFMKWRALIQVSGLFSRRINCTTSNITPRIASKSAHRRDETDNYKHARMRHMSSSFKSVDVTSAIVADPPLTCDQLQATYEILIGKIRSLHGFKYDYGLTHVRDLMEFFINTHEVHADIAVNVFVKHPPLGDIERTRWTALLDVLHGHGLPVEHVVQMVAQCPQIFQVKAAQLESCIECLRYKGFQGEDLITLLSAAPLLLVTRPSFIVDRIEKLKTVVTKNDIGTLLPCCPNVLFDDWSNIEVKIQYIVFRILVDQKQIVQSLALRYPLKHIQLRHQLMVRTGFYRQPHPKKLNKNPRLSKMVDTSMYDFAAMVGITEEEYEVFEAMFEKEKKDFDDDDDGDNSDYDSDDSASDSDDD